MDARKTGGLIAQARKEKGLTQKELAQALHVSAQAVSKWERGLNFPDLSLLEPLGECLGLTASELLSGTRGEEPGEELLRDSLRLVLSQVGRKLRRWRGISLACLALLAAAALVVGGWLVWRYTTLLPQADTVVSPQALTARERMIAQTARTGNVFLYDLTVGDGRRELQVQLELWTEAGLDRTWPLAELTDQGMPRHQTLAFSYESQAEEGAMALGVTLESEDGFQGTWSTTVEGLPGLEWGHAMNTLGERCTLDPAYGAVLACWSLPTGAPVPQGADREVWADYAPPAWTGIVEDPQVDAGARFLLLRLTVS